MLKKSLQISGERLKYGRKGKSPPEKITEKERAVAVDDVLSCRKEG